jgi:predicted MFS family arabinose efflux permease
VLAWAFVRDKKDAGHSALDIPGAVLATAGLGALTWGLTVGSGKAGWTPTAIGVVAGGLILSVAFWWVEKAKGERAMMPLALFGSKAFVGLTLLTLLLYGALGALMVLVPYVLIQASHYSGTAAGAALLPFPIILAGASPLMGALATRLGPRLPLTIGSAVVAVGFLLTARIGEASSYWTTVLPAILVIAIGMAFAVAPLTTAVLTSVDARHTGSASGFNSAVARTGGLIATALLGTVLAASGDQLIAGFRFADFACAAACLAAAASAFLLVNGKSRDRSD